MSILDMAAREYEKKKRDLDFVIEKKKSEFAMISEKINNQENIIKNKEDEIKKQKVEIEKLQKMAEENLKKYANDLEILKLNVEKDRFENKNPAIIWEEKKRPGTQRRKKYGS